MAQSQYADQSAGTHRDVLVSFKATDLEKAPTSVVLFATPVRVWKRNHVPRVDQCQRCWGFHRTLSCSRLARCPVCGSKGHDKNQHDQAVTNEPVCGAPPGHCCCPPNCTNCGSPHWATDSSCPARPLVAHGKLVRPQMEELSRLRLAGVKKRQLVNRCMRGTRREAPTGTPDDSRLACSTLPGDTTPPSSVPASQ